MTPGEVFVWGAAILGASICLALAFAIVKGTILAMRRKPPVASNETVTK